MTNATLIGHTAHVPATLAGEHGNHILALDLINPSALHFEIDGTQFAVNHEAMTSLLNEYARIQRLIARAADHHHD